MPRFQHFRLHHTVCTERVQKPGDTPARFTLVDLRPLSASLSTSSVFVIHSVHDLCLYLLLFAVKSLFKSYKTIGEEQEGQEVALAGTSSIELNLYMQAASWLVYNILIEWPAYLPHHCVPIVQEPGTQCRPLYSLPR